MENTITKPDDYDEGYDHGKQYADAVIAEQTATIKQLYNYIELLKARLRVEGSIEKATQ